MDHRDQPLDLLVRRLARHAPLTPEDRAAIGALPHVGRMMEAGSYLVREGDRPIQCPVLLSGYAVRHKLTGDGNRQIVSLHIPGEALDFQQLYLDVADHNVQTLTRAEVALVPRSAIQALVEHSAALARAVMIELMTEASIFREWVLNVGRRDARTRVAHLLCEFAVRLDTQELAGSEGYSLPMTQEQIGDAVGLTSVHVNRTLKSLELDGLITRNKRQVTFPDWARLRGVGDFGGRYLHIDPDPARG